MSKSQYDSILMWLTWIASNVVTNGISSTICSIASIVFAVLTIIELFKKGGDNDK